ncbi:hypothetical protein [Paenibacillus sp. FSL L8-0709]|uniref:hypothetical protein n=1 Tax=Paenibacillus sp. FSL L8-0709 TaxID=2975312 RepID=UPI0030F6CCBD
MKIAIIIGSIVLFILINIGINIYSAYLAKKKQWEFAQKSYSEKRTRHVQFNIKVGYFCSISLMLLSIFIVTFIPNRFSFEGGFGSIMWVMVASLFLVAALGGISTIIITVYEHVKKIKKLQENE